MQRKKPICVIGSSNQPSRDPPSKGASPFSPMGDITVDPKGVAKLLDRLNIHKAPSPDGLNARVLKECSNEISPKLALIFNESLAQSDVPDEWRQAYVSPVFKKVKNMMLLTDDAKDRCRSHASAAKL